MRFLDKKDHKKLLLPLLSITKLLGYHLTLSIFSGTLRPLITLNLNIKSKLYLHKISRKVHIA